MKIVYLCGHSNSVHIHKDGYEVVKVKYKCVKCQRPAIVSQFVTRIVAGHTLVIKRSTPR